TLHGLEPLPAVFDLASHGPVSGSPACAARRRPGARVAPRRVDLPARRSSISACLRSYSEDRGVRAEEQPQHMEGNWEVSEVFEIAEQSNPVVARVGFIAEWHL